MNQKLSDWASVAEIISAVAIVISLVFVGLEIRRSTEAEYLSSYDRLLSDTINWRMAIATNPETADAWGAWFEMDNPRESLDQPARRMGIQAATALNLIFEKAYFSRRYGRLGDQEWSRYQRIMCDPEYDTLHSNLRGERFSPEFWDYLTQCVPE